MIDDLFAAWQLTPDNVQSDICIQRVTHSIDMQTNIPSLCSVFFD